MPFAKSKKHTVLKAGVSVAALMLAGFMATGTAMAEAGDVRIRARGLWVVPDESATITAIGGTVDLDTDFVPEIDISYFFAKNWAVELVLASSEHNPVAVGTSLGDVALGDVNTLPPSLVLQYHPFAGETFSPYIGAGINYTLFFGEDRSPAADQRLDYSSSFGLSLQAGFDVKINDQWVFNVDVKRVEIDTDVTVAPGVIADVSVDPWTIGVGFGFTF